MWDSEDKLTDVNILALRAFDANVLAVLELIPLMPANVFQIHHGLLLLQSPNWI